ncbi:Transposase DDE domain-containing protein [Giesbergeria anulus]|uniref:Transposase DDE domain-containing protein n=1 Tax=Giesbergeria anulus TaxID=180197 RepID=A0A1H9RLR7_9BURK|nr:Transposase DDE domain-containing protein [Giesbergeria anulus]
MSSSTDKPKLRYRTTNWQHYNASVKARGSLTVWFDKGMAWFAAASGKRWRSPKFSDAAIQFCLTEQPRVSRRLVGLSEYLCRGVAGGELPPIVCLSFCRGDTPNRRKQSDVIEPVHPFKSR